MGVSSSSRRLWGAGAAMSELSLDVGLEEGRFPSSLIQSVPGLPFFVNPVSAWLMETLQVSHSHDPLCPTAHETLFVGEAGRRLSDGASKVVRKEYTKTRKMLQHKMWPG